MPRFLNNPPEEMTVPHEPSKPTPAAECLAPIDQMIRYQLKQIDSLREKYIAQRDGTGEWNQWKIRQFQEKLFLVLHKLAEAQSILDDAGDRFNNTI